jgi:hypothetical protein
VQFFLTDDPNEEEPTQYTVSMQQHPEDVQILVGDRTVLLEVYESDVGADGNTPTRPHKAAGLAPAHRMLSQGVGPPSRRRIGPGATHRARRWRSASSTALHLRLLALLRYATPQPRLGVPRARDRNHLAVQATHVAAH